jgi:hypothetical protein
MLLVVFGGGFLVVACGGRRKTVHMKNLALFSLVAATMGSSAIGCLRHQSRYKIVAMNA